MLIFYENDLVSNEHLVFSGKTTWGTRYRTIGEYLKNILRKIPSEIARIFPQARTGDNNRKRCGKRIDHLFWSSGPLQRRKPEFHFRKDLRQTCGTFRQRSNSPASQPPPAPPSPLPSPSLRQPFPEHRTASKLSWFLSLKLEVNLSSEGLRRRWSLKLQSKNFQPKIPFQLLISKGMKMRYAHTGNGYT